MAFAESLVQKLPKGWKVREEGREARVRKAAGSPGTGRPREAPGGPGRARERRPREVWEDLGGPGASPLSSYFSKRLCAPPV